MDNIEEKYFLTRGRAILFLLILIIILIIYLVIKAGEKNLLQRYKDFELEMKNAAINYVQIKNIRIDEGEEITLKLKNLTDMNLVQGDLKNECSGYVIVSNEKNIEINKYELNYNSYIKCSNKYMTTNYSDY